MMGRGGARLPLGAHQLGQLAEAQRGLLRLRGGVGGGGRENLGLEKKRKSIRDIRSAP